MKSLFPNIWPAVLPAFMLLALLALLGCQGDGSRPTPVSLDYLAPARVTEFVPGVHRYVDDSGRLVFATPTPVPAPTVRPTPDFSRLSLPTVTPVPAVEPSAAVPAEFLSCLQEYRRMLVGYDGRIPFGAQVAYEISESLRESRPDCVEQGWKPVLSPSVVCVGALVAGVSIDVGLTRRLTSGSRPQALPTGRDSSGNILVHFSRLPMDHARGCWYYQASRDAWAWHVEGGDFGLDRPRFPACDVLLQEFLAVVSAHEFSVLQIARAIDEVRREISDPCSSSLWELFPGWGSHEDCSVAGNTGVTPDGVLLVTWHEDYLPSDYAVCWVLRPGADAWEFSYVVPDLPEPEVTPDPVPPPPPVPPVFFPPVPIPPFPGFPVPGFPVPGPVDPGAAEGSEG